MLALFSLFCFQSRFKTGWRGVQSFWRFDQKWHCDEQMSWRLIFSQIITTDRKHMILITKRKLLPNPQNVRLGTQVLYYCFRLGVNLCIMKRAFVSILSANIFIFLPVLWKIFSEVEQSTIKNHYTVTEIRNNLKAGPQLHHLKKKWSTQLKSWLSFKFCICNNSSYL